MSKKSAGDDSNDASESTEATLTALTTNISEFVLNGTLDTPISVHQRHRSPRAAFYV
jgi:hypothetical protein